MWMKRDDRVEDLLDYAMAHPTWVLSEAAADLGWSIADVKATIRPLRSFLADFDYNLVCESPGTVGEWIYKLVGSVNDSSPWIANRMKDSHTRLRTISNVNASIAKSVDKRTVEGRKANLIHTTVEALLAQLDAIDPTNNNGQ
jgi:hypothetical protein